MTQTTGTSLVRLVGLAHRLQRLPANVDDGADVVWEAAKINMELIAEERKYLYELFREGKLTDEARRRIERELDLEEAAIACREE